MSVGENVWFSSDTHFGHENIIRYTNRIFKSARQMDDYLIKDWNKTVSKDSWVIHLGDVSFQPDRYISNLNGKIILVKGNHDSHRYDKLYEGVVKFLPIKIGEFNCYLTHIPVDPETQYKKDTEPDFTVLDRYDFIICGHVHEKWVVRGKNINVGFDIWNRLIHIDELIRFLRKVKRDKITDLKSLSDITWEIGGSGNYKP